MFYLVRSSQASHKQFTHLFKILRKLPTLKPDKRNGANRFLFSLKKLISHPGQMIILSKMLLLADLDCVRLTSRVKKKKENHRNNLII